MNVDEWRGRGRPKKIWMDCATIVMSGRRRRVAPTPNKMG